MHFSLRNDVAVYGGFDGTESLRSERDYENNLTVLSGDIGTVDVNTDNVAHVIYIPGRYISDHGCGIGWFLPYVKVYNDNYSYATGAGAGLYIDNSACTIRNCVIDGKYGI